jgi:hypothetical protein
MTYTPAYAAVISAIPLLLAHLAGIVVAIVLLARHRSTPAILALIGFGVLFILDLANFGRGPLIGWLARRGGVTSFWTANAGVGCCCSIFDVAALACLIVAIWQAVSAAGPAQVLAIGGEDVTEELTGLPQEAVEESE